MDNSLLELTKINQLGDIPANRFGHTIVFITKAKICLFGGSVGNSHKLNYNNETFTYNILTKIWKKINIKNPDTIPSGRAAHSACAIGEGKMAIYGGSIANGGLAEDILNIFKLNLENENEGEWSQINSEGTRPGQRYGHSLNYLDPFIILFGGNLNPQLMNDIWVMNMKKKEKYTWIKIDIKGDIPVERLYHSSCLCPEGKYMNKLIIFGGRNPQNKPLNDLWALTSKNTAAGIAQIAKIKSTQLGSGGSSAPSAMAATAVQTQPEEYVPQYTQNATGESEITRLADTIKDQKVYVVESDITEAQNRSKVRVTESTW